MKVKRELGCEDAQRWIQRILQSTDPTTPSPALVSHIASCHMCQGAFALLAAEAINLPAIASSISCRRCELDLAAFVEQELEQGSAAAIRTYPHVWWHLWTCEECTETYRVTRLYLLAQQSQAVAKALAFPASPAARPTLVLQLPRAVLHHALAGSIAVRATTRGGGTVPSYVIAEQDYPGGDLEVRVQRQANGEWRVDAAHQPPRRGALVLICGDQRFHADFDAHGRAAVHDVPFALLTAPDGPDMEIGIEPDPA